MDLEETLGEGYKQVLAGLGAFLVGAIWGANGEMSISGMYIPLVIMMLGALVAILGMSLGTGGAHGESFDLKSAMDDMAGMLTELQGKVLGGDDGGDDSGDDGGDDSGDDGE
jgi:hypothetical protein